MAIVAPITQALERDRVFVDTSQKLRPDEFQIGPEVLLANIGQRHEITTVPLPGHGGRVTLEMTRFRVFAPDAKIVVHSTDGDILHPIPKNSYYRGKVVGDPDSAVVMTVLEGGEVRGLVVNSGRYWVVSGDSINKSMSSTLRIRKIEPTVELEHDAQGFECGTDSLEPLPPLEPAGDQIPRHQMNLKAAAYTARIAVETDNEFYSKFGNETDATNYVADIIAFGSTVYSAQVSTSWLLQDISLWPTGTPDPWSQSSPECGLYEFGRYWNNNNSGITRTVAHFMSGKNTAGGIAWVGVLCYPAMLYPQACPGLSPATDYYAGDYGYSGGLDGNFDFDNPAVVWDIVAVTHEIGHNFNSPHTHCYSNLEGNSNPIDECYGGECGLSGCHCGGTSLPSGCPGGGNGCGTIMSYCHAQSGGMGNISLTLGEGHPYGTAPERVPTRMAAHVASRAAASPGCLDYISVGDIFADGFESGNTTAWSSTLP
jgi:hypothetical protein